MTAKKPLILNASNQPQGQQLSSSDLTDGPIIPSISYTGIYYDPSALTYEFILTYTVGSRTVTLTPTGSTFRVWVQGTLYTKSGAQTITHTATSGDWYFYYDNTGTLQASQTPWNILDVAPIMVLVYNATTGDYLSLFECHHYDNPPEVHSQDHYRTGTFDKFPVSDFAAAAYTLGQKNDAGMQLSLSSGTICDEEITYSISALSSGGPYKVWAKIGASGNIQLAAPTGSTNSGSLPFIYNTTTTYIQYNQFTGSVWQMTDVGDGNYVNYYVFECLSIEASKQFLFIPGQAIFSSLAAAQAELSSAVNFLSAILPEFTLSHQLTFLASKHNSNNGMCSLSAVTRQILSSRGIVQGGTSLGVGGDLAGSTQSAEVVGILSSPLPALSTGFPYYNGSSWVFTSNLPGTTVNSIPYQSSSGVTSYLSPYVFTSTAFLTSASSGAPTWKTPGSMGIGYSPTSPALHVTGNETATANVWHYCTGDTYTLTLPALSGVTVGTEIGIIIDSASLETITIAPSGSDTIQGLTTMWAGESQILRATSTTEGAAGLRWCKVGGITRAMQSQLSLNGNLTFSAGAFTLLNFNNSVYNIGASALQQSSTGEFLIQRTGVYQVSTLVSTNSSNGSSTGNVILAIYKNGSSIGYIDIVNNYASNTVISLTGVISIQCNAGDYLQVYGYYSTGSYPTTVFLSSFLNHFTITEVPQW